MSTPKGHINGSVLTQTTIVCLACQHDSEWQGAMAWPLKISQGDTDVKTGRCLQMDSRDTPQEPQIVTLSPFSPMVLK